MSEVDVFERDVPAVVERPPLPDGWRWGEVAEVGAKQKNAIVDGPFGSNLKLTDYVADGTVPVLTTKNLAGKYDDLRFISEQKFQELKRSAVYPNDILMAKIGSCGKTGIYPVNMPPAIIPANLLKVTLNENFDKKFVFHYFNSRFFQRALKTIIRASAQPAFGVTSFRKLPFPIAPLSEQLLVVAEIEKQFSRLDEAVANLQRVKANLKRYKASVLKAAVEGRLVETEATLARREGRTYETGEQLLQRILEERRAKWTGKGKYKEPSYPKIENSSDLPPGWAYASIDQLAYVDVGFAFKSAEFSSEGLRLLRGENIEPGRLRWTETRYWPESRLAEFRNLLLEEGEIILAMDRPLISSGLKLARVRASDLPCLLVQRVARLRCVDKGMESYLHSCMSTQVFERHLLDGQTGTQLPHVSGASIGAFVVPVPPASEQIRVAAEVDRHLSIIREVEAEVDANLQRAQALRQATLIGCFQNKGG